MPPWAATVCERVGKTLVMQAVFRPAWAQPSGGAQARAAGADDDDVEAVVDEFIGRHQKAPRRATLRMAKTPRAAPRTHTR
jgi:hypothetical protein